MAESPATEAIILPGAVGGGVVTHLSALQPPGTSHLAASSVWDPTASADWDNERASAQCVLRIKRDIMSIYKEPPPGMFVVPDPHDMTKVPPPESVLASDSENPDSGQPPIGTRVPKS
ncbi:hypothetical protein AB205_0104250 [Aquarana catesbeiana]|uniref:Uncharacterized protein n=1 Tax=Aquarana catesbeiana TaxID=8400 RepID=A0A2G9R9W7_AQUCT|nr:hypothetical protein AB205_0104250 [Aquarana catesbeiana]